MSFISTHALALPQRKEVPKSLSELICASGTSLASQGLSRGIYDANVTGKRIFAKDFGELSEAKLETLALHLGEKKRAFAFGRCDKTHAWIAAFASAAEVKTFGHVIEFKGLEDECREVYTDYASEDGGKSIGLLYSKNKIDTTKFAPGYLSISCLPKENKNLGPRLLFLVPVKQTKNLPEPSENLLGFLHQVNKAKIKEDKTSLLKVAQILATNPTLDHDRILLAALRRKYPEWHIIGENRGMGANLSEVLKLFWASPRHRNLLLADATHVAAAVRQEGSETFVVLVFAKRLDPDF